MRRHGRERPASHRPRTPRHRRLAHAGPPHDRPRRPEGNDFWRANVLSLPKLRQKFDTLRLQAQRPQGQPQGGQVFYDLAEQFAKEGL